MISFERTPWLESLPQAPLRALGVFFCLLLLPVLLMKHGVPELYITPATMMTALLFCIGTAPQLGLREIKWRDVGIVLIFYLIMMIVISCLSPLWELLLDSLGVDLAKKQDVLLDIANASGKMLVFLFVCTCLITPFVEEVLFRRIIYGYFATYMPAVSAALITSLLFSMAHFFFYGAVSLFIMGLAFNLIYILRRNLWLAVMLHSLVNIMAFVFAVFSIGDR